MRILKSFSSLLLFFLAYQTVFANTCYITKGRTTPFGTTYCVPEVNGAVYLWSPTGTLNIVRGQGTACVTVTGWGELHITRDFNNTHCYTSIVIPPGDCDDLDPFYVYISGDFTLDHLETGTFYANASGGNEGTYSYRWYRSDTNGGQSVVGLSSSYSAQFVNEGPKHEIFWVKVEVRDSCGQLVIGRHFITVDNEDGFCGEGCEQ